MCPDTYRLGPKDGDHAEVWNEHHSLMKGVERILPMLLLFAMQAQAIAQDPFNRRYDSFDQGWIQEGWSVEHRPSGGYFVIHMSQFDNGGSLPLLNSVLVLNAFGELDTITRVPLGAGSIYCGWSNCSHQLADGRIVIGGSRNEPGGIQQALLIRFDEEGNFMSSVSYMPEGTNWIGRQAKQAADGGFVLAGVRSLNSNLDGFLIKTDANGEQEWVQTYGGPWIDSFIAVDTVDGGYYLGGVSSVTASNRDFWIQRVDGLGEPLWESIWGGPFNEPNAHLSTCADGHVVMASGWKVSNNGPNRLYMAKLDSANGSIMWEHTYGSPMINTTFFVVKEVEPNGDLIATGQASLAIQTDRGVLLRTTQSGDSLWMRYYSYYDTEVTNGQGQLRDVLPTADGGFIAVGAAFGVANPVNPPGYGQDVWVIKTDSMGCLEPGCHLITGMETQITNLGGALKLWPNPVARGTAATLALELPEHFTPQGALRLTVVGSDGRVVREERLPSPAGQFTLQAPASSGVYHVHLSDDTRWIAGAKLVVE